MKRSLKMETLGEIVAPLRAAQRKLAALYPGPRGERQPVHTVYGGAHLFQADTAKRLGKKALESMEAYAPNFVSLAKTIGLPGAERLTDSAEFAESLGRTIAANKEKARVENRAGWLAYTVYQRVREKLQREPVEDFRIDFEDGFGNRPEQEEDRYAMSAAGEVAAGMSAGSLPPFIGIRIKPFNEEMRERSIRTLDIFLTELVGKSGGKLPENFFITLPKIMIPEEAAALAAICSRLESALGLGAGVLRIELMIETPQSVLNERGEANLLPLVLASGGRCVGAHFGTYDYTAGRGITAAHQNMTHLACDFAREVMQVALAGTGIWLSDGATNVLPVTLHHAGKDGAALSSTQIEENRHAVQEAWRLHFEHIQHSLKNGYYQGWDLHPAQLVTRYAAVYEFFLESLDAASERLRNFISKAAQATLVGEVFDDAATGQGLLNYFLRAMNCGAVTGEEVQSLTGLTLTELRSSSFVKILEGRKA